MLVSVIGDSISTFEAFNPPGYAVYYDKERQIQNGLRNVYDTWWAKVNQALHAYLCVNNSYSGSRVSGDVFPSACSDSRLLNLSNAYGSPDLILVFIGFNDFGNGIRPSRSEPEIGNCCDTSIFMDAYQTMLVKLHTYYPQSLIVCGTLVKTFMRDWEDWLFPETFAGYSFSSYNEVIRRVVRQNGCLLADLASKNIRYETLDGSHPTIQGHQTLYELWEACLKDLGFPVS